MERGEAAAGSRSGGERELAAGAATSGVGSAGTGAASFAEFTRTLEERIEKRRQVYRTLIEHDPDRGVLRAWGVGVLRSEDGSPPARSAAA